MLTDDVLLRELSAAFHSGGRSGGPGGRPAGSRAAAPAGTSTGARPPDGGAGRGGRGAAVGSLAAGLLSPGRRRRRRRGDANAPRRRPRARHKNEAGHRRRPDRRAARRRGDRGPACCRCRPRDAAVLPGRRPRPAGAASVRDAATGRVLSTVSLPAGDDPKLAQSPRQGTTGRSSWRCSRFPAGPGSTS